MIVPEQYVVFITVGALSKLVKSCTCNWRANGTSFCDAPTVPEIDLNYVLNRPPCSAKIRDESLTSTLGDSSRAVYVVFITLGALSKLVKSCTCHWWANGTSFYDARTVPEIDLNYVLNGPPCSAKTRDESLMSTLGDSSRAVHCH